jgi:hypothetical protein
MKKRSKYKPRPVITDPLSFMRPASKDRQDAVMLSFYTALHELTNGNHPGTEEWRTLSDAINTTETLATHLEKLDAHEVMPLVNAAIAGMVAAAIDSKLARACGLIRRAWKRCGMLWTSTGSAFRN